MLHAEGFKGLLIFLVVAGVIVPLFHRARIGTVLAFLLVGVVLGPYGLGRLAPDHPWLWYVTFDDPDRALPLAELGIVFLLFLLGLELSLDRLWKLRRYVLGVGLLQVGVSTVALGVLLRLSGAQPPASIILGLCLALSSTAIVMQLLAEQRRTATQVGRIALSVLLFQDLMVVPILFIVGVLAGHASGGSPGGIVALIWPFLQALAVVGAIMLAGRYLFTPLLRSAARTGSRDLIMAITLLIVIGISAVTGSAGLSYALGAFLAGLLLSDSEYRHHIETDLEPFKGLLLGIFFITVGTSIDVQVVLAQAAWILVALLVLIAVKAAIIFAVARAFRVPAAASVELALLLAQAGEFAFVVVGLARGHDLVTPQLATSAIAVVGLGMMVSPVLAMLAHRASERLARHAQAAHAPGVELLEIEDHVVIGGFGRVGRTVADLLDAESVPFIALDGNSRLVGEYHKRGQPVYFGDASRAEMLERAGARRARAFVVTVDDARTAEHMVRAIRELRPDAPIYARAKDAAHAARLAALGCMDVIPEAVEASLQLGARVLECIGLPEDAVVQRLDAAREHETAKLQAPASRRNNRAGRASGLS